MRAAPVGYGVEFGRKGGVAEKLGFFVLGVIGEGEGVVGDGAAAEDEDGVSDVFAELGIGRGRGWWVGQRAKGAGSERVRDCGGGRGFKGVAAAEEGVQRASEIINSEHLEIGLGFSERLLAGRDQESFLEWITQSFELEMGPAFGATQLHFIVLVLD